MEQMEYDYDDIQYIYFMVVCFDGKKVRGKKIVEIDE
jgi:hypothetical protein